MQTNKKNAGFTLVELAIVLVIIGLLVGGVLVGQDLIKAAEIRAVSSDIEKFNTGAAAFRTKYSGVPGDILATKARNFGLSNGVGTDGTGDGDGILENNTTTKSGLGGENVLFWTQLSEAQFIPYGLSQYSGVSNAAIAEISTATAPTVAQLQPVIPQLRIRDTGFVHAFGSAGLNYYTIGDYSTTNGGATGALTADQVLSPREALGVDEKIDDGNAARGIVLSWTGLTSLTALVGTGLADGASAPTTDDCYDTDDGAYSTSTEELANSVACALRIRSQF